MRASHRVGARHRYETWPLRSAPCLSSQLDGSSRRQVCTCHAAKRAGLWICGQRKGVAHIPTGQTAEAARFNSMVLKKEPHGPRRLTPRSLLLRSADFITKSLSHLYTDSESRSQLIAQAIFSRPSGAKTGTMHAIINRIAASPNPSLFVFSVSRMKISCRAERLSINSLAERSEGPAQ